MIYFEKENQTFYLESKNVSYVFCVQNLGFLNHLYYGKRIPREDFRLAFLQRIEDTAQTYRIAEDEKVWIFITTNVRRSAEAITGKVCLHFAII